MAIGELNSLVSQWTSLCLGGVSETQRELARSNWNDGVGKAIKDNVEATVDKHLDEVLRIYGRDVQDIDLYDYESLLKEVEDHLVH